MSTTYNIEPPPTAKVLLQTTSGDIELELFAKQTPLASRNFLQHCLNGYYDGTIFHRLVPGFVLQGGDPTGTGDGGESAIYDDGRPFADEAHSRLKFNRRGLLGMANTGKKDDNMSQFFITLGTTNELTGKNTMFGRVAGDTIYNVLKMGEAELMEGSESERPLYPTTITGAEILLNPFDDMVKSNIKLREASNASTTTLVKKKPKKKGTKVLLSFGENEREGDSDRMALTKRPKHNHKLESARHQDDADSGAVADTSARKSIRRKVSRSPTPTSAPKPPQEPKTQLPLPDEEEPEQYGSTSPEPEQVKRVSSILERTNAQIAELKASMKRSTASAAAEPTRKLSALEAMIPPNAVRGRKRKQGNRDNHAEDTTTVKMLNAFRARLDEADVVQGNRQTDLAATESEMQKSQAQSITDKDALDGSANVDIVEDEDDGALCDLHFIANCQSCKAWDKDVEDEVDDPDDQSWMSHALMFGKDRLGKDLNWKKQNEDDLIVIDPREKAHGMEEERRQRRDGKKTNRAWDQDRGRDKEREWDRDGGKARNGDRDGGRDRHTDRDRHHHRRHAEGRDDKRQDRDRRDQRAHGDGAYRHRREVDDRGHRESKRARV